MDEELRLWLYKKLQIEGGQSPEFHNIADQYLVEATPQGIDPTGRRSTYIPWTEKVHKHDLDTKHWMKKVKRHENPAEFIETVLKGGDPKAKHATVFAPSSQTTEAQSRAYHKLRGQLDDLRKQGLMQETEFHELLGDLRADQKGKAKAGRVDLFETVLGGKAKKLPAPLSKFMRIAPALAIPLLLWWLQENSSEKT